MNDRLGQLVRAAREESGAPGFGAIVSSSDATLARAVDGVRKLGAGETIAPDDRFHLGSNAKAMTATVAALAVEDGLLTWETDAADVLPDVPRRGATLLALLSHSSGLRAYAEDEELDAVPRVDGTAAEQRLAFARRVLAEEPAFAAGAEHRYSNAGYAVAAAMLEHVRGEAWEDQLRRRLFAPLRIDGGVGWPAREDGGQPWGHYADGQSGFRPHDPTDDYQLPPFLRPAGDVNASLEGYARFLRLHLRGLRGDAELLGASSFERLHRPVGGPFALGWGVQDLVGARASVHAGSADTFYAVVALQPDHDLAVAVVANAAGEAVESAAASTLKAALTAFTAP